MELTRNIDIITSEIIVIRDNAKRVFWHSVIQIGRRLEEAKALVPQGEWTAYLTGVLGFKPSTAQYYMRIAREMGDEQVSLDGQTASELFGALSYAQLVPLLGLPDEERRELAENHDLRAMSTRQIEKLTQDLKNAQNAAENAGRRADELSDKLEQAEKAREKADKAGEAAEAARMRAMEQTRTLEGRVTELLEQLQAQPAGVAATVMIDEEALAQERERVRAEMQAALEQAEARAEQAAAKLEKAKSPAIAKANFLFGELQNVLARLTDALTELAGEQPETADRLRQALRARLPALISDL